jgi:hypothetical protein
VTSRSSEIDLEALVRHSRDDEDASRIPTQPLAWRDRHGPSVLGSSRK